MPSTKRLALIVIALFAVLASSAQAAQRTTTYYTINIAPQNAEQPGLFLAAGPNGTVNLQRYVSGAPGEQWAPVYPEWPSSPTVTGHGPIDGITECTFGGCPFSGHGGGVPYKFVNRLDGTCLTFVTTRQGTRARLTRCSGRTAAVVRDQSFEIDFPATKDGLSREPTAIEQVRNARPTCLTVGTRTNAQYATMIGARCESPLPFYQTFRFLQVDQKTCEVGVTTNICGLPSWWRA